MFRGITTSRSSGPIVTSPGTRSVYASVTSVPMIAMSPLVNSQISGHVFPWLVSPSSAADLPIRRPNSAPGSTLHGRSRSSSDHPPKVSHHELRATSRPHQEASARYGTHKRTPTVSDRRAIRINQSSDLGKYARSSRHCFGRALTVVTGWNPYAEHSRPASLRGLELVDGIDGWTATTAEPGARAEFRLSPACPCCHDDPGILEYAEPPT